MATSNSPLLENTRGKIGDSLVIKQYKNGTVISAMPCSPKKEKSYRQKIVSARFAEGVKYAKSILRSREKKAAYAATLPPDKQVYHAAIQEYVAEKKRVFYLPPGEEMRLLFADTAGNPVNIINQLTSGATNPEVLQSKTITASAPEKTRWDIY